MPPAEHSHATLIAIEDQGVLITGPSGSGKTLLALHLYRRCRRAEISCTIIADDQVLLSKRGDALIGTAPKAIEDRIEIRGFGIAELPKGGARQSPITLHVGLTDAAGVTRMWDGQTIDLDGVPLRTLSLSTHQLEAAGNAILSALGQPVWI